ncbi:MAG: iron-sulfur cluster assembly protein [Actinomycetota bacterium]|nr:iron-sulfur cluster assembly protein [Actinomycetota bacterium]
MSTRERVFDALSGVRDPELDEPITSLRFVSSCTVSQDGDVEVLLRLPTPQCAPNFAFLMAADARDAVRRLPEVRAVSVQLEDHFTGEEINAALGRGEGFTGAFPGETDDDRLDSLRELFRRKALLARQGRVCQSLLADGQDAADVVALTVAELPPGPETNRCLELRAELGLPDDEHSPGLIAGDGASLTAETLNPWLRRARLVSLSLESNGGICRSLLRVRHGVADPTEEMPR